MSSSFAISSSGGIEKREMCINAYLKSTAANPHLIVSRLFMD
jgi:hypothetical protein